MTLIVMVGLVYFFAILASACGDDGDFPDHLRRGLKWGTWVVIGFAIIVVINQFGPGNVHDMPWRDRR
jgi:hypothetical protein